MYGVKLKGVSVCFTMLKAVLSGNYVNFGVFRLYGDDALDNALQTFIKLLLSIPHSDLLVRSPGGSSDDLRSLELSVTFRASLHCDLCISCCWAELQPLGSPPHEGVHVLGCA